MFITATGAEKHQSRQTGVENPVSWDKGTGRQVGSGSGHTVVRWSGTGSGQTKREKRETGENQELRQNAARLEHTRRTGNTQKTQV